jgi:hypothetical protein
MSLLQPINPLSGHPSAPFRDTWLLGIHCRARQAGNLRRILYLGFESRLDPVLALAVERMTGLRVESGLVQESHFRPAHARMLNAKFPPVELIEASSEPALVEALARRVERVRPSESRLVRMHDCLWLRMWPRPQKAPLPEISSVEDVLCSIRAH